MFSGICFFNQPITQTEVQIHHSPEEEAIITNTPIPQKLATQPKVSFRELQNLQSTNNPGTLELSSGIPFRRNKRPFYQKARFIYDEALGKLKTELEEFDAQSYHNLSPEVRAQSDIRLRYRSIRIRDQVFTTAAQDLAPILEREGMAQELKELKQNIESVSAQVTSIKLTHVHDVSVFIETFGNESDARRLGT